VEHLLARKGAARIALIPPEVLEALNTGLVPTVHLNEFLAIDLRQLARNVAVQVGLPPDAERLQDTLGMLSAFPPVKRHEHVARALYDLTEPRPDRDRIAHALASHPSDVARCWAAQWIAFTRLPLAAKLQSVSRFAADPLARPAAVAPLARGQQPLRAELGRQLAERCRPHAAAVGAGGLRRLEPGPRGARDRLHRQARAAQHRRGVSAVFALTGANRAA
jgi:hypothetical protein